MLHEDLTEKVIGCAFRVYNAKGFGFNEKVYENCMMIELRKLALQAQQQFPIKVYYEDECVGDFDADLFVGDEVLVELKSVRKLAEAHEQQLVNYLVATRKDVGLLINFGPDRVEVRRKVRDLKDLNNEEETK